MTGGKHGQQSYNSQQCVGIKHDQLYRDMTRMCLGEAKDKQCHKLAIAEVSQSPTGMSVAGHQDHESKPVIDLDNFEKMCDEINSLENGTEQGRLTSNAQAIKGNVDKYIYFLKHARENVYNKSLHAQSCLGRSVASYELELLLRFENIIDRLQKLSSLLDASEIELRNKMETIKEVSRPLQSLIRILERKLSKFLHEYMVAVANGSKSINKERSTVVSLSEMDESSEEGEDDWKVVLPSPTIGDTKRKGKKNKKTKKVNKGKRRKK